MVICCRVVFNRPRMERQVEFYIFLWRILTKHLQLSKPIQPAGALPLSTKHRVAQISRHPHLPYVAIQSHDRSVEIFRIRTESEALKKQARRRKRAKEKAAKTGTKGKDTDATMEDVQQDEDSGTVTLEDLFTPYLIIRASGKIRSFDFPNGTPASETKGAPVRGSHFKKVWSQIDDLHVDYGCSGYKLLRGVHDPTAYQNKRASRSNPCFLSGPSRPSNRHPCRCFEF